MTLDLSPIKKALEKAIAAIAELVEAGRIDEFAADAIREALTK